MGLGLVGDELERRAAGVEGLFKPASAEEEPGAFDVVVGRPAISLRAGGGWPRRGRASAATR